MRLGVFTEESRTHPMMLFQHGRFDETLSTPHRTLIITASVVRLTCGPARSAY